ncbi:MAG: hypothetical protein J0H11_06610 [Rhizobiales bacterium]|nr:hypothetical protein [Hyphomicrobiales bacterium]
MNSSEAGGEGDEETGVSPSQGGSVRQLALSLPHNPQMTRADFLIGTANENAAALIDRFPDWQSRIVLLVGPAGSGKTHLGRIWSEVAGAAQIAARDLREQDVEPLLAGGRLLVEDVDRGVIDEPAMFHLINRARERGAHLLLTSRQPPASMALALPDLISRLRAALLVELLPPDDALLERVLVKLFADRQLRVDPALATYVVRRIERSLEAANRVVAALDEAALAAGRPVTRQLAAEVLDRDFGNEPELPF